MGASASHVEAYSHIVENSKVAGSDFVHRHPRSATAGYLISTAEEVTTAYENFQRGVKLSGDGPCLGSRPKVGDSVGDYVWKSYNQVNDLATKVSSAIIHLNLCPPVTDAEIQQQGLFGLYSINREEWVICEQACNMQSIITVPLYDTLGADAVEFILSQTNTPTVACTKDKVATLLSVAGKLPTLKAVIQFEKATEEEKSAAQSKGIRLFDLEEIYAIGTANPQPLNKPKPESILTFCYTSGTTGNPKGAILTHGNFIASVTGVRLSGGDIQQFDSHISYLPLAHTFERAVQMACYFNGAAVGFYQGNTLKILDDLAALRPTIFVSVPRLFNRIYDRIIANVEATGGVKKTLFYKALKSKKEGLANNQFTHSLWDKLVMNKVKARLGGRVRLMCTGSAPISGEVMDFLKCVFGCDVFEGYGQTECAAACSLTHVNEGGSGFVGGPITCCDLKLVDVPEMSYTSEDKDENGNPAPRGEVCIKGNNVFKGYYKDAEKTAEALDNEGWLHTGDIGMWLPNGALKIIDRKKNIFKLSQGEYVAAEKIENIYQSNTLVAQAFVYGDSLKSHLVGIIVPDEPLFKTWAAEKQFPEADNFAALCKNPTVVKAILDELTKTGKAAKLASFEQVKVIHLSPEPFTVENNCLTPTFKLKRNDAKKVYQKVIDELYAQPLPARD